MQSQPYYSFWIISAVSLMMTFGCKPDSYTSLQGRWTQEWYNPFLNEDHSEVWKLNLTGDSLTFSIFDSLGIALVDTPDSFKMAIRSDVITIYGEQGDSMSLTYYANPKYDTMSLKFPDHSSRVFTRTPSWTY